MHCVVLDPFWIDPMAMSNAAFLAFVYRRCRAPSVRDTPLEDLDVPTLSGDGDG